MLPQVRLSSGDAGNGRLKAVSQMRYSARCLRRNDQHLAVKPKGDVTEGNLGWTPVGGRHGEGIRDPNTKDFADGAFSRSERT